MGCRSDCFYSPPSWFNPHNRTGPAQDAGPSRLPPNRLWRSVSATPGTLPRPARARFPRLLLLVAVIAATLVGPAVVAPKYTDSASAAVYSSCTISRCTDARTARSGWAAKGFPTTRGWYSWSGGQYNFAGGQFYAATARPTFRVALHTAPAQEDERRDRIRVASR